jgi:hypothetical protein
MVILYITEGSFNSLKIPGMGFLLVVNKRFLNTLGQVHAMEAAFILQA